jgi:hypothetical protein
MVHGWASMGIIDITCGFILAYRITNKADKCSGKNTFLQKQQKQEFNYTEFKKTSTISSMRGEEDQSCRLTLAHVLTNKVACFPSLWDAQKLSLEMRIFSSVQNVPFSTCARKKSFFTGIPRAARGWRSYPVNDGRYCAVIVLLHTWQATLDALCAQ